MSFLNSTKVSMFHYKKNIEIYFPCWFYFFDFCYTSWFFFHSFLEWNLVFPFHQNIKYKMQNLLRFFVCLLWVMLYNQMWITCEYEMKLNKKRMIGSQRRRIQKKIKIQKTNIVVTFYNCFTLDDDFFYLKINIQYSLLIKVHTIT